MPEWLVALGGALIGGLLTSVSNYASIRARVSNLRRDVAEHENQLRDLSDKYITRREYESTLKMIRYDLDTIKESVGAIRDFLLSQTDAEREDIP